MRQGDAARIVLIIVRGTVLFIIIHIEKMETIRQRRVDLFRRNILPAGLQRAFKRQSTLVISPFNLGAFVNAVYISLSEC